MRRAIVLMLMLAGLAFAKLPVAAAQSNQPPAQNAPAETAQAPGADDGRYSFHRVGEGFVRLDLRTGQVAQCGWSGPGWACKLVPDERAALDSEIARLQRDNVELKKSLLSRGIELPAGVVAEGPAAGPVPPANVPDPSAKTEPKMPSDAELDRAFAFMKKVWRRLVDMMTDLQRDMEKEKKS
jgi:hypothetical protein